MSRLALIGCGAIAESFYLPAIVKKGKLIRDVILVDRDESRLKKLSALYDVSGCVKDFHEVVREVDGAIVALPHQLHYETSVAFLKAGAAVLCEKPLAESTLQAKDMIVAAKQSGVALLVNKTRRLFPNTQKHLHKKLGDLTVDQWHLFHQLLDIQPHHYQRIHSQLN